MSLYNNPVTLSRTPYYGVARAYLDTKARIKDDDKFDKDYTEEQQRRLAMLTAELVAREELV